MDVHAELRMSLVANWWPRCPTQLLIGGAADDLDFEVGILKKLWKKKVGKLDFYSRTLTGNRGNLFRASTPKFTVNSQSKVI